MVALDSTARAPSRTRYNLPTVLIGCGLLGGLCAVGLPLALNGSSYDGWSLADRTTNEFAGLLFLLAFLADPFARLFPHNFACEMQFDSRRLALGFAAAYGVNLAVAVLAAGGEGQRLGAPQLFGFSVEYSVLMALAAASGVWPGATMSLPAWRRIHIGALWFFWLVFSSACVGHFSGPHVADSSYGVGLFLLLAALFVRFAAALKSVWMAEKVA